MFDDEIKDTEKDLQELALHMLDLKKCMNLEEHKVIRFQIDLAECLYKAMSVYNKISQRERKYVEMKDSLDKKEFQVKMRKCRTQKLEIKKLINIGKSIGDAFAYIFYRDSIEELEKHYTHPDNGLFVSGIGGRGEIEFIKAHPVIDGYLVVYHAITHMLRIGDFSLCSLNGKVIGIGEIKSEYVEEQRILASSVYMSSSVELNVVTEKGEEIYGSSKKEKVQKQLKNQDALLKSGFQNSMQEKTKMNAQHSLITKAYNCKECIAYSENMDIAIIVIKEEYDKAEDFAELLDEKLDNIIEKLIKDSVLNNIRIVQIGKEYSPFRKPIIWWNISDNIIMDILFNKIIIVSIANFASYYEFLIAKGFCVEIKENKVAIGKKCGEYISELENFEMIEDLIMHEMYAQEDVAIMVSNIVENVFSQSYGEAIVRISVKRNT